MENAIAMALQAQLAKPIFRNLLVCLTLFGVTACDSAKSSTEASVDSLFMVSEDDTYIGAGLESYPEPIDSPKTATATVYAPTPRPTYTPGPSPTPRSPIPLPAIVDTFSVPTYELETLSVSPDGLWVVKHGTSELIRLDDLDLDLDPANPGVVHRRAVVESSDGKRMIEVFADWHWGGFGPIRSFAATWTPDSKHLVLLNASVGHGGYSQETGTLMLVNPSTRQKRILSQVDRAHAPILSPDGKRIGFVEGPQIHVIDLERNIHNTAPLPLPEYQDSFIKGPEFLSPSGKVGITIDIGMPFDQDKHTRSFIVDIESGSSIETIDSN